MRRLKKNYFLALFCGTVAILGVARWTTGDGEIPTARQDNGIADTLATAVNANEEDSIVNKKDKEDYAETDKENSADSNNSGKDSVLFSVPKNKSQGAASKPKRPHRIYSVPSYSRCFPDLQDVQIVSAKKHGIRPVENRKEAEERKKELVYIGSNPFYKIDPAMSHSIPYLVPRAAMVLETIARNYLDSLHVKGVPLHKIMVSSVLRTNEGVRRLMRINPNASPESCHRYGTTFDITYMRHHTVSPPGEQRHTVQNDTLKWILAEVLRDLRTEGRCYVKYEVKQGCFHITAR